MIRNELLVFALGGLLLAGCAEDDELPSRRIGAVGENDHGIAWQPCALATDGADRTAQCADLPVPVRWDNPEGRTIEVHLKRRRAMKARRGQMWFLQGGPGASVIAFEGLVEYLLTVEPSLDYYMLEHRGVGLSTRLSCPAAEAPSSEGGRNITEAEIPECRDALVAEWGDDLAGFSTTNAARDLGELIEKTRDPGEDVFVYGVSYGSHWGHRYLELYPTQPTGVILSALTANTFEFAQIDRDMNDLGQRYLTGCAKDALCSEKLGIDPWGTLTALMAKLGAGHCPELGELGLDRTLLKTLFVGALYGWDDRALIPPVIYRVNRCSDKDLGVLGHLADLLFTPMPEPPPADSRFSSDALYAHIALSEMWPSPGLAPSTAELEAFAEGANIASRTSAYLSRIHDAWPRYPKDEHMGKWAVTDVPLLLQHGELDFLPASAYEPTRDRFTGPNQTFVLMPRASHDTLLVPSGPSGAPCGLAMILPFLKDPYAPIDTSCMAEIAPLDFKGNSTVTYYLGVADPWEGVPQAKSKSWTSKAWSELPIDERRRRLRERFPLGPSTLDP
jgi:pimeloyl-ACP methyl ester carboxylesterase